MKKGIITTILTVFLFISCTSSTSKIENAVKKLDSKIVSVENIKITEEYPDSFRSPSDKGTTYKFTATFTYSGGETKELSRGVFIADKDGVSKWK